MIKRLVLCSSSIPQPHLLIIVIDHLHCYRQTNTMADQTVIFMELVTF